MALKKLLKKLAKVSIYSVYRNIKKKKLNKNKISSQLKIIDNYYANNEVKKLQIGCGNNILEGWLNTDLNFNNQIAYLDAGKIFPLPSNSVDFIYSEHIFEHLLIEQQVNMLSECYRVLKKNGVMRMSQPNLNFLFEIYKNPNEEVHKTYVNWSLEHSLKLKNIKNLVDNNYYIYVINNFFKAWGHQVIHNFESLKGLVEQNGFANVLELNPGESSHKEFINIEKHGTVVSEEINKFESMVVEMQKL